MSIMIKEKYAIRFPSMQNIERNLTTSIFSEKSIMKTSDTFFKTFDALGSLTGYVVQKNRTNELSKQLKAQEAALDATIDNLKEQQRIEFEEYSKRLQINLQYEKHEMELEMKKLAIEASKKVNNFSVSFEEMMKTNQILLNIIQKEQNFLNGVQDYIDKLADNYSQRKEYVIYCDLQRKALDLVNAYLNEMV